MVSQGNPVAKSRRDFIKYGGAASLVGLAGCSSLSGDNEEEEDFPSEPIEIIAAVDEGSQTDVELRAMADPLSNHTGVSVSVRNVPGGATMTGVGEVALAEPDGYMLTEGFSTTTPITNLLTDVGWDAREDLAPLLGWGGYTLGLFANPKYEVQGFQDAIDRYADGEFNVIGGRGHGHPLHILPTILKQSYGMEWNEIVTFDSVAPIVDGIIADDFPMGIGIGHWPGPPYDDIDFVGSFGDGPNPTVVLEEGQEIEHWGQEYDESLSWIARAQNILFTTGGTPTERQDYLSEALESVITGEEFQSFAEESDTYAEVHSGRDGATELINTILDELPNNMDVEEYRRN